MWPITFPISFHRAPKCGGNLPCRIPYTWPPIPIPTPNMSGHGITFTRKKLPDPKSCCGGEIPQHITSPRVHWPKRVWYTCVEAMEKFEKEIVSDIESVLRNTELGYADLFLRVFMIGRQAERASPKIMICCINSAVRKDAERAIRESGIMQQYPEYGLGATALPLNEPIPSQELGGGDKGPGLATHSHLGTYDGYSNTNNKQKAPRGSDVFSPSREPDMGRRLVIRSNGGVSRVATGGIIINIDGQYYQRTVGHLDEKPNDSTYPAASTEDLSACQYDGDSDDQSDDDEVEQEADYDATTLGSLTSTTSRESLPNLIDADSDNSDIAVFTPNANQYHQNTEFTGRLSSMEGQRVHPHKSTHVQSKQPSKVEEINLEDSNIPEAGSIAYHCRDGGNVNLDYALVQLEGKMDENTINKLRVMINGNSRILTVNRCAPIVSRRGVVAVTASGGTIHGTILPDALYFRKAGSSHLQKLYSVSLDEAVSVINGDCGADVVDDESGHLYGHIVRGCPGTPIAYIIPAVEVFDDLERRIGSPPVIGKNGESMPAELEYVYSKKILDHLRITV